MGGGVSKQELADANADRVQLQVYAVIVNM